jgi:hypothetical protein
MNNGGGAAAQVSTQKEEGVRVKSPKDELEDEGVYDDEAYDEEEVKEEKEEELSIAGSETRTTTTKMMMKKKKNAKATAKAKATAGKTTAEEDAFLCASRAACARLMKLGKMLQDKGLVEEAMAT